MHTMIKKYNIYNYQDILNNEDLKQKVLEKYGDINVNFDGWYNFIIAEWTEKLEQLGFIDPLICFTGFYSQGDGASFTADIDIKLAAQKSELFTVREINLLYTLWNYGLIEAGIKRITYHYCHENTTALECYDGQLKISWTHIQKVVNKLWKYLEKIRYNLSKEIFKDLETEYNYLTDETTILETLKINEYEFYENGSIIC